jgi:hypothetical protein
MAKTTKLTDSELCALIDNELRQAFGYGDGKLEQLRRRNMYYFMAEAKEELAPPSIEGRSKVVDTTGRDTVLGMHGPLMKTFYGSDNVFEFEETRPEDAPKAKLISEYVNHVLRNVNPGFQIIGDWIFEALTIKNGILKVWWDSSDIETKEEYSGLTIEQLTMLMDDAELELTGQKSYEDPDASKQYAQALQQAGAQLEQIRVGAGQGQVPMEQYTAAQQQFMQMQAQGAPKLYDVTVKRTKTGGRVCIENVPPEEFVISKQAKSIKDTPFCAHRFRRTVAELRMQGYDVPTVLPTDDAGAEYSLERTQRLEYLDDDVYSQDANDVNRDESMRSVWVLEAYLQTDQDGDGIPEWRKVVKCGDVILENEEFDAPPFVALGSIPLPHQFYGLCPMDLAIEYQKIKTSLTRAQLDNIYLQINRRHWAIPGQVNLDDLLNSRPGGIVRVQNPAAIGAIEQGMGDGGQAMALMEYFEQRAEEATGWTRQSQGGSGNQLQTQTATQANIITNRADMRIEAISRYMAETGMRDLGMMIFKLVSQYQRKSEMVKISGEWVNIDPREWVNKFTLNVNVGLGTGNKDQLVQHLMMLGQQQMAGLQIGFANPQGMYANAKRLANALGFKNADEFFTDPAKAPPQPPQPNPEMAKIEAENQRAQAKMQADQQTAQMQAQFDVQKAELQAKAQIEVDQMREQAQIQQHGMKIQQEAELAAMKAQYEAQDREAERAFRQWQIEFDAAAKAEQAERDRDNKIVLAQITAQQKNDAALAAAEQRANQDVAGRSD